MNVILEGRVIAPGDETGIAASGYADVVMKALVEDWVGTGAPADSQIDDLAVDADAWSSSVDLPMPGSPLMSTREPATSPPPRTRLNSARGRGIRSAASITT